MPLNYQMGFQHIEGSWELLKAFGGAEVSSYTVFFHTAAQRLPPFISVFLLFLTFSQGLLFE